LYWVCRRLYISALLAKRRRRRRRRRRRSPFPFPSINQMVIYGWDFILTLR